jgi:hypothetical protein
MSTRVPHPHEVRVGSLPGQSDKVRKITPSLIKGLG